MLSPPNYSVHKFESLVQSPGLGFICDIKAESPELLSNENARPFFFLHARQAKACFTAIENVCLEYIYFVPKGKRSQLSTNWEHMIWIAIMSWHAHGGLSVLKWPCNKFCLGQTKAANHGRINMLLICNCNVRFYKFEAKVAIKLNNISNFPFCTFSVIFFNFSLLKIPV